MSAISVKKVGIDIKSPSLIVFYENEFGKLHRRFMPIRNFSTTSLITSVVNELYRKHHEFLKNIAKTKIEWLVRLAQHRIQGVEMREALNSTRMEFSVNPDEDLNKAENSVLERKKSIMNESFEANRIKRDDPDFQYDVEVDFHQGIIESSEWDSDKDDPEF